VKRSGPIKVLIVDDSPLVRSILTRVLSSATDIQVVGGAKDPYEARDIIIQQRPDVIILDIEMPRMNGLVFLRKLMVHYPVPVIMCSGVAPASSRAAIEAIEAGAVDVVCKPNSGGSQALRALGEDLVEKVRAAAMSLPTAPRLNLPAPTKIGSFREAGLDPERFLVLIGASTGGTEATREVLMRLPPDAPAVLITQHMPPGFTKSYAARLDTLCRIRVAEARDGERVLPGHAYIAPGGFHLSVERSGANYIARVRDGEPVNRHKPSVEVLFQSAARVVGPNALGVMLTGMGADGARAMKEMRDAGSWNVVQDEASCVVFGMPREAIAQGAAHEVLPVTQIAGKLIERLRSTAGQHTTRV